MLPHTHTLKAETEPLHPGLQAWLLTLRQQQPPAQWTQQLPQAQADVSPETQPALPAPAHSTVAARRLLEGWSRATHRGTQLRLPQCRGLPRRKANKETGVSHFFIEKRNP